MDCLYKVQCSQVLDKYSTKVYEKKFCQLKLFVAEVQNLLIHKKLSNK
jgi:hypothetical protein